MNNVDEICLEAKKLTDEVDERIQISNNIYELYSAIAGDPKCKCHATVRYLKNVIDSGEAKIFSDEEIEDIGNLILNILDSVDQVHVIRYKYLCNMRVSDIVRELGKSRNKVTRLITKSISTMSQFVVDFDIWFISHGCIIANCEMDPKNKEEIIDNWPIKRQKPIVERILDKKSLDTINSIELPLRIRTALRSKVYFLEDLAKMSDEEILVIRNMGISSLNLIKTKMAENYPQ